MLPPVPVAALQSNPRFAALYEDLKTKKLNSDGSTRRAREQKKAEQLQKDLVILRKVHAKRLILLRSLVEVGDGAVDRTDNTDETLLGIVALASALLTTPHLLSSPKALPILSAFTMSLPSVAGLVSTHLRQQSRSISSLYSPKLDSSRSTTRSMLQDVDLHRPLARLLTLQTNVVESLLLYLERTIHSTELRHRRAHLTHVVCRATLLHTHINTARLNAVHSIYDADTMHALRVYARNLLRCYRLLEEREKEARDALAEFDANDLGKIVDRFVWLNTEIQRARDDIKRLEG